jgi:hypothetical protein
MVLAFCGRGVAIFILGNLLMGRGLKELIFSKSNGYDLAIIKILVHYI